MIIETLPQSARKIKETAPKNALTATDFMGRIKGVFAPQIPCRGGFGPKAGPEYFKNEWRGGFSPRLTGLGPGAAKMYYVYILKSQRNSKLYKGITNDLKRRVKEHNSGKSAFTKNNGPWKLIYYEAFLSEKDAKREELFLKSGKGRERINYLFTN